MTRNNRYRECKSLNYKNNYIELEFLKSKKDMTNEV